jgi:hypothetical protein
MAEQKITLNLNDSTVVLNNDGKFENAWRLKTMVKAAPAGINVPSNKVAAMTFQFKPGMPYDSNSVMIYQRDPVNFTGERVNYFGYRFSQNSSTAQWRSTKFFNHSLFSDKENAYYAGGNINNGWTGFIPGNAYFEGRHLHAGMFLTSTANVGVRENNSEITKTNLYPNPSRVADKTMLSFEMAKSGNVTVEVYSLVGQLMKSTRTSLGAGAHEMQLDLGGMNAGIYMVNITVNGVTASKKLTIMN